MRLAECAGLGSRAYITVMAAEVEQGGPCGLPSSYQLCAAQAAWQTMGRQIAHSTCCASSKTWSLAFTQAHNSRCTGRLTCAP